jgi:ATP-dependent helicase/nuclease subunit B
MVTVRPRVFTIASGLPFLPTLAQSLLSGKIIPEWPRKDDPLAFADATIYVPTRRAARAFLNELATRSGNEALLLPRVVPLGGLEDVEDRLILERGFDAFDSVTTLLPDMDPIRRRLILTRLVLAWSKQISETLADARSTDFNASLVEGWRDDPQGFIVAATPHDAVDLADALGTLIDTLVIYGKTWADLHALVPNESDDYWRISKHFLEIAAATWPALKEAEGVMDMAERRHRLLTLESERLIHERPEIPVIAAGSTGSMPATASLLAAIAKLPRGAVVLPDLDQGLDEASFALLTNSDGHIKEPSHPQAQLAHLLKRIGLNRQDVTPLGQPSREAEARMMLLSEAMRPAESTDLWKAADQRLTNELLDHALSDLTIIEAQHEREEALAIALALRETIETPDRTAALITPDRSLATRVRAELKRWAIDADDSAGQALSDTSAGLMATALGLMMARDFEAVPLISLLDHTDVKIGFDDITKTRARKVIDLALLRQPFRGKGLSGLKEAWAREKTDHRTALKKRPQQRLSEKDYEAALRVLNAFESLEKKFKDAGNDLAGQLIALAEALLIIGATSEDDRHFETLEGAPELLDLLNSAAPISTGLIKASLYDLPPFLNRLMRGVVVESRNRPHPRIGIFGLLEARLLHPDRVILAGLDESIWPPQTRSDPFLTRPAREALGLPSPERRIGQTAHDFVSALGVKDAMITRANKRGGQPVVASRFLQRLRALTGEERYKTLAHRGEIYLSWAHQIDSGPAAPTLPQPKPVPPRAFLPKRLSVTSIETLRRDPYSIYARYVLKLDPLDLVGRDMRASDLGSMTHEAISAFTKAFPEALPENAFQHLIEIAKIEFAALQGRADFEAFWWRNFCSAAAWLIDWEAKRRLEVTPPLLAEQEGFIEFEIGKDDVFRLSARADRIEILKNGKAAFIDFKTGEPPGQNQINIGLTPQLTLEAVIAKQGGFVTLGPRLSHELLYVKLGGKKKGSVLRVKPEKMTLDELIDQHFSNLKDMINAHWNEGHPFLSRPIAEFARRFGDYDHLARVKEWSRGGEEGSESE